MGKFIALSGELRALGVGGEELKAALDREAEL